MSRLVSSARPASWTDLLRQQLDRPGSEQSPALHALQQGNDPLCYLETLLPLIVPPTAHRQVFVKQRTIPLALRPLVWGLGVWLLMAHDSDLRSVWLVPAFAVGPDLFELLSLNVRVRRAGHSLRRWRRGLEVVRPLARSLTDPAGVPVLLELLVLLDDPILKDLPARQECANALKRLLPRCNSDHMSRLLPTHRAFLQRCVAMRSKYVRFQSDLPKDGLLDDDDFLIAALLVLAAAPEPNTAFTVPVTVLSGSHPNERVRAAAQEYLHALEGFRR
jgi:hypothetical protein